MCGEPLTELYRRRGELRGNVRQMSSIRAATANSHQSAALVAVKNTHRCPLLVFQTLSPSPPLPFPAAAFHFSRLPPLRALRLALARISSLIVLVSGSAGVSSYIFTSAFYRAYRGLLTALAVSYLPAVYSADTFFQRCSGHSQLACLARPWIF